MPTSKALWHVLLLAAVFCLGTAARAQQKPAKGPKPQPIPIATIKRDKPVSFFEEVLPILEEKCLACHSLSLAESKLNLEEVSTMLKGGKRGPAIVPGRGAESLLIKTASRQLEPYMPPPEKKDYEPLTPEELGLIKLWIDQGAKDDSDEDAEAAIQLSPLPPHLNAILAVALSPDGRYVAVGRGNLVQVYDVGSGTEVVTLSGHLDYVQCLAWSPDGRMLASGSYKLLKVWIAPGSEQVAVFVDGGTTRGVTAHAGSATLGSVVPKQPHRVWTAGLDGEVKLWATDSGALLKKFSSPFGAPVGLVAVDGERLLLAGANNVAVVDASGKPFKQRPSKVPVRAVAAEAAQQIAAIGYQNGTIEVVALPELKLIQTIKAHGNPVVGVCFAPGAKELISWSTDGTVRVWDPRTAEALRTLRHGKGEVRAAAVSPNGNLLVTAGVDKVVRVWNFADLKPYPAAGQGQRVLSGFAAPLRSVRFSPDGTRVAIGSDGGELRTWEIATGRVLHEFKGHYGSVNAVCYVDGGARLLSVGADRTVRLWDCSSQWREHLEITSEFAHRVLAVAFSPDGRWLATGGGEPSRSGEIKLFDARTGELVRDFGEPHSDTVFGVAFRPDGTMLASCGADKMARVFDLASGQELRRFEGHTHHVLGVVWRWDGQRVVTCGADNVLKVWDFKTGEQVRTIGGHSKQVTALAVVPRTNQVVSCGADAQVRRYNTDNGGTVRAYGGAQDFLYSVSVDAGGRWVAAGGQKSVLWIWDLNNGRLLRQIGPPPPRGQARR